MTMISLFFYRELMKFEPNNNKESGSESENESDDTPHYENDPVWDSEDEYCE